ncbi:hypothetical protein GQ600_17186 [Phytophthora cactorum]|nr:hypothetical protein GQ600_17186 [Phytophthora cactorum]
MAEANLHSLSTRKRLPAREISDDSDSSASGNGSGESWQASSVDIRDGEGSERHHRMKLGSSRDQSGASREATRLGPTIINACVRVLNKDNQEFAICITKVLLEHNHVLSKNRYELLERVCNALDAEVVNNVNVLRKAGATRKNTLMYIVENTERNPTIQDVHNLVRRLKKHEEEHGIKSSTKRLRNWMEQFGEASGNIGRIFIYRNGDKKIATCITIGVQVDNYSCGMFALTVFQIFTGAQDIRQVTRKELHHLRYRYLCKCV